VLTADDVRAADIKLCTEYALVIAATPKPLTAENGLVATMAAVRTSLAAHPEASSDLQAVLNDVVEGFFATLSDDVNNELKGLVEPPEYDKGAVQATYDRAWARCGFK